MASAACRSQEAATPSEAAQTVSRVRLSVFAEPLQRLTRRVCDLQGRWRFVGPVAGGPEVCVRGGEKIAEPIGEAMLG